jgi:NADH-quinone oxidoreductase subunit D
MSIYEPQGRYQTSMAEREEDLLKKQKAAEHMEKNIQPDQHYYLNLGPQHPSTHGVFRAVLEMDGENVVSCENQVGYLHRGIEKLLETKTWAQVTPYTDRLDYLGCILNEWGYLMGVEELMGVEVPERGEYVRVILGELQRIASHLVYTASMALDMNGYTVWMYMFREREKIFDILEAYSGSRMNNNALRIGGAPTPLPEGVEGMIRKWATNFPKEIAEFHRVMTGNEIFQARTKGVGVMGPDFLRDNGVYGVNMRSAGVKQDLRKDKPYSIYDRFDFEIPVGKDGGDCFDRWMVRMDEMEESTKIILQALDQMPKDGPTMGKVPKMIKVPAGSVYSQIEASKGWLGYYIVSDGGAKPYRIRLHTPSIMSVFALPEMLKQKNNILLQDFIASLASIDIVLGDVDR